MKFIENSAKDIESKTRQYVDDVKRFREEQVHTVSDSYEAIIGQLRDELNEAQLNLDKATYKIAEMEELVAGLQEKMVCCEKECIRQQELAASRELIIKTQRENSKMLENNIREFKILKEELEISLKANIVNFKMKEDELETLLFAVSAILVVR